ncbi:hypothetical protein QTP88_006129 [Uroleucon formosanum]
MLKKQSFGFYLIYFNEILQIIHILSKQLQKKDTTLEKATSTINGVIKSFDQMRSSSEFSKIWNLFLSFATEHNISTEIPTIAEKNVAFCYPCKIVGNNETKEIAFSVTGYSNWKKALENNKGFYKHQSSSSHRICIKKLVDKQKRVETISTFLNKNVLENHRYYVKSIFEIIIFLVVNELPFRGDFDLEMHEDKGLFQSLFRYTLKKDTKLAKCAKLIPQNATYLSPVIQNETINIMHNAVQNSVVEDLRNADVPWYTIMKDGTKDNNNRENIPITIRYVKNGKPIESLLSIKNATNLNAAYFVQMTLDLLKSLNINTDYMLSQCSDGASVGETINAAKYCETLKKLRRAIQNKRRGLFTSGVCLLHDNARPHTANVTKQLLDSFGWDVLNHPPYSPDLAPSDYHLFTSLKKHMGGKKFSTDEEVKAVDKWSKKMAAEFYKADIKKLICRITTCIERNGDYVEK